MNTGQAQPGGQPNPFANLMGGGFGGQNPMSGGMGNMPGMPPMDFNSIAQMMQNPFVQNMMQQIMSNPQLLQQVSAAV
jgi:ubiquilin